MLSSITITLRACRRSPIRAPRRSIAGVAAVAFAAVMVALGVAPRAAAAEDPERSRVPLLSAAEVRWLEARGWLERDVGRVQRALGAYADRVAGVEGVRLGELRLARLEALECVLGRVAARHLGVAQLFSDPLFAAGPSSLGVVVDAATMASLDQVFDMHTIFPPTARPAGGGAPAHMLFMLAGQGRLALAYDRGVAYEHADGAYAIFGNREYRVYPYVRMTVGRRDGSPALYDLGVADGPREPLRGYQKHVLFLWPEIHGLLVRGRDVTADTSVINRSIRPPPIDWRNGAAYGARRLAQNGCPADGPWTPPAAAAAARVLDR